MCLVILLNYMYIIEILIDFVATPKSHKYPGSTPHSGDLTQHMCFCNDDYFNHFSSNCEE